MLDCYPSWPAAPCPGRNRWPAIVFTPTAHPLTALATHIAALTGADPATLAEELAADSPSAGTVLRQVLLRRFRWAVLGNLGCDGGPVRRTDHPVHR
jgi:hypothetical protein